MTAQQKSKRPDRDRDTLPQIVSAMSEEIYLMANQIAALGEALSESCETPISSRASQQMQLFDTLCQRALMYSRLLQGVGEVMSGEVRNADSHLRALIEEVPFEEDRQRLRRALGLVADASGKGSGGRGGELDLF